MKIKQIYKKLYEHFGSQNWWPVHEGADRFLEVSIGAILTQNTNWKNVEKAIENLINEDLLSWEKLLNIDEKRLSEIIKPAGFYRQKSKYIKNFVSKFYNIPKDQIKREDLLKTKGIGEETADSILLYGLDRPFFVIDSYTKRFLYRIGIINSHKIRYRELQDLFHSSLPKNVNLYKEYHALIVELCKAYCRKKPLCSGCPFENECQKFEIK